MVKKLLLPILTALTFQYSHAQQNALDFDGVDDYVNLNSLGPAMGSTSRFMIQFWVKGNMTEQGGIRTAMFSIHDNNGNNKLIVNMGGTASQTGRLVIYTAAGFAFQSSTVIGNNQCHHIFLVKDGSICRVFIDGNLSGQFNTTMTLSASDRYSIGQEWDLNVPSDFFNGSIDELSIWNQALFPLNFPASINLPLVGNEAGLVGYYTFDQGVAFGNNTTINYLSDFNVPANNGTLTNFTLTTAGATPTAFSNWVEGECFADSSLCANANEISLDGTNDYVNLDGVNSSLTASTNFTVEFWMRANLASQGADARVAMFSINNSSGGLNRFCIWLGGFNSQTGNIVITDTGASGTDSDFISTQVIADDTCHHIAYTRNGAVGSIYLDGVLIGTHVPDFVLASTDRYSLGQEYDGPPLTTSQFYEGIFDEFRIWNVARTQAEISSTMTTPLTGSEPNLLVYYNFNQGVGGGLNTGATTVLDLASGINGTLVNFALTGSASNWVVEECVDCEEGGAAFKSQELSVTENSVVDSFESFVIYPNPSTGISTISAKGSFENSTIQIYDVVGNLVFTQVFDGEMQIETASFEKGVYLVVLSGGSKTITEKLIIQ